MTSHWCHGVSVSGPVDPSGCCADQPPTHTSIAAGLRAEVDRAAADRLAKGLRGERA